jgi:hypothetical protein
MKLIKIPICFLLAVLLCGACKKDKSSSSPADILQNGKWQMIDAHSVMEIGDSLKWVRTFDSIDFCAKDNFILFESEGKAVLNFGTIKCDLSEPQVAIVYWEISTDGKQMLIGDDSTSTTPLSVLSLNSSVLKLAEHEYYYDPVIGDYITSNDTLTYGNIK